MNPETQNQQEKTVEEPEKINILLHEYDTLREEIIGRTNNMYQMLAVGSAVFIALLSFSNNFAKLISLTSFCAFVISFFCWMIKEETANAAARLRELEEKINIRAGEPLLTWENKFGKAKTSWYFKSRTLFIIAPLAAIALVLLLVYAKIL
jgi:hypothetical protein